MKIVKKLKNNRKVIFDKGNFDDWCVYIVEKNGTRRAPFDVDYFSDLQSLNYKYMNHKIYKDFMKIYEATGNTIDQRVIEIINELIEGYEEEDRVLAEQCFTVLYAGMIAEENKKCTILKKRIKHLGVYQILVQNLKPEVAANFSRHRKWRELDRIMREIGI